MDEPKEQRVINLEPLTPKVYRSTLLHGTLFRQNLKKLVLLALYNAVILFLWRGKLSDLGLEHIIILAIANVAFLIMIMVIDFAAIAFESHRLKKTEIYEQSSSIKFVEEGFMIKSARGEGLMKWKDFSSFWQNKRGFVLKMKARLFLFISKEKLSEDDLSYINEQFEANIKK